MKAKPPEHLFLNLIANLGRIGELGSDSPVAEMKQQLAEMQDLTQRHLNGMLHLKGVLKKNNALHDIDPDRMSDVDAGLRFVSDVAAGCQVMLYFFDQSEGNKSGDGQASFGPVLRLV